MEFYYGKSNEVRQDPVKIGKSRESYIRWLVTRDHGAPYAMRKFTIKEKGFIQMHYHDYVETLYILKGKARVCVGKEKLDLEEGDFIFINSRVKHAIVNAGEEDLEFICVIDYPKNMDITPLEEEC
ncbi:MAG: cupin domain-containing protein [Candidatus Aramenus sp.]|nr:cupin domain-containing protein [Candidatus Aramenus sp.]